MAIGPKYTKTINPHKSFWVEELSIECLDGCFHDNKHESHKIIDMCSCEGYIRCAMHQLQDCLTRPYPKK